MAVSFNETMSLCTFCFTFKAIDFDLILSCQIVDIELLYVTHQIQMAWRHRNNIDVIDSYIIHMLDTKFGRLKRKKRERSDYDKSLKYV